MCGPARKGQLPGSIGVLEAPDKPMPSGIAPAIGRTEGGLAVCGLRICGADVLRRWVTIDRRFVAVECATARNRSGLRQGGRPTRPPRPVTRLGPTGTSAPTKSASSAGGGDRRGADGRQCPRTHRDGPTADHTGGGAGGAGVTQGRD